MKQRFRQNQENVCLYFLLRRVMEKNDDKMKFQDQIAEIFRTVFMAEVDITSKAYQKIREVMLINTQEVLKDALKRAIRREATLNSLELPDLLYAIEKRGEKYKLKIGKTLISASDFGDYGQRKYVMNYEEQGDQNEDQIQK